MHKMGDMPASPDFQLPEDAKDKVMHTALFINESTSDIVEEFGQKYVQGNNSYVMLDA